MIESKQTRPNLFLWLFALNLIADQALKMWCRKNMVDAQTVAFPIPGVLELNLTYNKGIAFGLFQGLGFLFIPVALVISWYAFRFCSQHPDESKLTHVGLGLLASGAVGNLIDRAVFGQVTDMFLIRLFHFPVFNFADSCITIGAILLVFRFIFERKPEVTAENQPIT